MESFVVDNLCHKILAILGGRHILLIGHDVGQLTAKLLDFGINVHVLAPSDHASELKNFFPGRIQTFVDWKSSPATGVFDTVVACDILDSFPAEVLPEAIASLRLISRDGFMITTSRHPTEQIEMIGFKFGMRRSLSLMEVAGYEGLNSTIWSRSIFMEPLPRSSLNPPSEPKVIQYDMSRRSGPQADAGIARYHRMSWVVSSGDTVLDVGCGAGYGTAMIARHTMAQRIIGIDHDAACIHYANNNFSSSDGRLTFEIADAAHLRSISDNSIDVVTVFGVLDAVIERGVLINEMARILKKGGRIIASVRNMWSEADEPSMNLLNWEQFRALFKDPQWLIEMQQIQTAGGGIKLKEAQRQIHDFASDAKCPDIDTEWCILTVMKSPLGGTKEAYIDRLSPELRANPDYHLTNWKRDYDNPALFAAMICRGERMSDRKTLSRIAETVAENSRSGSADQGAALCVLAYQLLERKAPWEECAKMLEKITDYLPEDNKQAFRWRISLDYVCGLICQGSGLMDAAKEFFIKVAAVDVSVITPTLGTKTVQARMRIADLCFGRGQDQDALLWLQSALKEAQRLLATDWLNVVGTIDAPNRDGLREITAVAERAAIASMMLNAGLYNDRHHLKLCSRFFRWSEMEASHSYEVEIQWGKAHMNWLQWGWDTEKAKTAELTEEIRRLKEQLGHSPRVL